MLQLVSPSQKNSSCFCRGFMLSLDVNNEYAEYGNQLIYISLAALQFGTFSALKIRDGWPKAQKMRTDCH